ncbi:substrate-binding domain-containing protein [Asaia prunellae]|uniref:substrate-binding domain-containing protein n=1 Tax=Asaia prunellae TaxID=610245 RepID=UPI000470DF4C|nr:substrate-binding domain-containing protein [Asaia prunellae]
MPVVLLLTDIPNTSRLAYVGIDNMQAGRVIGTLMGRYLGPQPCAALCLSGFDSMAAHVQRREGFHAALRARFRHIRLVDVPESTFDRAERAADILYHLLASHPDIRGIYNAGAGGAPLVEAIRKRGRTHDTVFITHELTPDRTELLKEGCIDALIDQDPLEQVTRASRLIASHFRRLPPSPVQSPTLLRIFTPEMIS